MQVEKRQRRRKMTVKQLTLFKNIDEKEIQNLLIMELHNYRALKVQIENKKEREEAGVIDLFPPVRKEGQLNELKVRQVDRALNRSLDFTERRI
jgi:hypothetical protein